MPDIPITCRSGEPCQLKPELDALKQEVEQLSTLVSTDTLTGLYNYRHFSAAIGQEMERSQRTGQPTTLIMLDADYFKKVNDQWGHETGNQALKLIANCIRNNIRKLDIACRYGGEEFAVILPSTDLLTAIQVAERIRVSVEQSPLAIEGEADHSLTLSLGLSSHIGKPGDNWHKLVERADSELYRAKQQGRNQSCYSATETTTQQVSDDEKAALFDMFRD
jgi:diguanylate cyclase (GGDEF)-like protein